MKKIATTFVFLFALTAALFAQQAVLVAHYGSSSDATRKKTIDLITAEVQQSVNHGVEVCEAYISAPVRKNLSQRGIIKLSVKEALEKLAEEGYKTVTLLPTTLIEGGEMTEVREVAASCKNLFSDSLQVIRPLLYSIDDFAELVNILAETPVAEDEVVVYMGHGNQLPSTASYTMLDYMLQARGHERIRVSTIEGYPDFDDTVAMLRKSGCKKVRLYPLLLVCGNHTLRDIDGEWREKLTDLGFEVTVEKRGLAEVPAVRRMYVERILK